ncbi:MAG TPA: hypothetical protein VLI92_00090, partial [Candidatus Saccharimonadales bacterium]|nr:hypothetical protein [Candidatus Saccharimonadales bacterium]
PTGTKLTGATIQYNTAAPKDILKDIIIWNVKRYDSFETSFVLKPTEKLVLKYTYDLPQSFTINNDNKQYRLYWQKQPGTVEDPFTFNFSPPFGMKILELNSGDGSINFEGKLTTDQSFSVNLR